MRCSTVLAQLILVVSYIWAIVTLSSYRHKRFSLSFYNICVGALSSALGVLRYGNPLVETQLSHSDQRVMQLSRTMYPALVSVELLLLYWPETELFSTFLQLFTITCTLATILWIYETRIARRNWSFIVLREKMITGPGFAVALAMSISILNNNFHGCVASILMAMNTIFISASGMVFEVPARDLYSYIQCFSNYHIVKALTD